MSGPALRRIAACVPGLLFVLAAAVPAGGADRPNVLVILADDMGFSDAGCYGGEIRTPNLDRLAEGGLRFTQFYNTARCWPTRASLLTGYYPQQVRRDVIPGLPRGGRGARPEWARLLPELLAPLGYRSYHSGKWHVDGRPLAGGFDRSYLVQDQDRFFSPQVHFEDDERLPPVDRESGYYATIAIVDHAIKCLREHEQEHADRPFFHYLAFTAPHFPLHALQEDIDRYRDVYLDGWDAIRARRHERLLKSGMLDCELPPLEDAVPAWNLEPERLTARIGPGEVARAVPWDDLTDEQKRFQAVKMAIHAAMIDRMDREIGRVLRQIERMDALENTVVFFFSDNGASAEQIIRGDEHDPEAAPGSAGSYLCLGPGWSTASNTPFRRHKSWVHEGGTATPLIVHWPQGIAARGELRHNPGHAVDLAPTIVELAGGSWPEEWNGRPVPPPAGKSLVPVLASDGTVSHEFIWWFHSGHRAVRVGDWKLVAEGTEKWELYNLRYARAALAGRAGDPPKKGEYVIKK
jgi:arylsulfatase A-like enzyme